MEEYAKERRIGIGKSIKMKRQMNELSQSTLARLAGVGINVINRAEAGEFLTLETLLRIADALHIPAEKFFAPLDYK